MRKALNENPMVQIGALAVLALVVAVVFMMQMGGDSAEPEAATDTAAPATAPAPAAASASAPTTPETSALPAVDATTPVATGGTTPFEPGKGLPEGVVDAYESGDVVVLYLMQNKEVEDEKVRRHVEELRARSATTVFVSDVKEVSRYSRIVEGVSLNRVPAIIVLAPLKGKLAKGEPTPLPSATVSYGFRSNRSVAQTVRDALYAGKRLGYDPG